MTTIIDTISFEEDFYWTDQYNFNKQIHNYSYALSGALIIQSSEHKLKGREITLESGENYSVVDKVDLDALNILKDALGYEFTLNINGDIFNVQFRHSENPIEAIPLVPPNNPPNFDKYKVKMKFIEV
ncbi:MAG: hypothetical protein KAI17_16845 [Thiotrichaceae bacterium]|nr:hypothetical protein [Thiotrichaceae bacterium]